MEIRFATTTDNQQLLALCRTAPMAGQLVVNVERHPNYFTLAELQGDEAKILVAVENGALVGAIGCALRDVILADKRCRIAYIGGIKLAPQVRKGLTAYRLIKALYDYLLTTEVEYGLLLVMAGNQAMAPLLAGRAGIPRFYPVAEFAVAYCLPYCLVRNSGKYLIRPATPADEPQLYQLWDLFNRQLSLRPADLSASWKKLLTEPNFSLSNFLIAEKDGAIIASVSTWDQQAFKQTYVASYGFKWSILTSPLRLWGFLPRPGIPIKELNIRHILYANQNWSAARYLLQKVVIAARSQYQLVRLGIGNYYPPQLLQGIPHIKIPLTGYLAAREMTSENLRLIQHLTHSLLWEDLCLH